MQEVQHEEAKLRKDIRESQIVDEKTLKERKAAIQKKKVDNILNLLKNLGDMVTAS